jgi:hypothetical protein
MGLIAAFDVGLPKTRTVKKKREKKEQTKDEGKNFIGGEEPFENHIDRFHLSFI